MKKLNLNAIRIDGGTQSRVEINNEIVGDYADAIRTGIEFPPVVVFHDGADYWLADGFHRFHAHSRAGKASILTDVRQGTVRDAVLYSLGANAAHGLHRSNADKRKAVQTMLADPEWNAWSQERIAKACGVSSALVSKLVAEAASLHREEMKPAVRTVERAGKTYQQDTSNIGKSAPPKLAPPPVPSSAASTPAPAPAPAAAEASSDGLGDEFDPVKELEAAHAELTKLSAEIAAAEADDLKAEAIKWRRSYEHAQRQQSEAMDRAKSATDREAWTMKQLRRCGKAVGEDDPKKIAAAVEATLREVRKAA